MKKPIVIQPGSPFYQALEHYLKRYDKPIELVEHLPNIGIRYSSKPGRKVELKFSSWAPDLVFDLVLQDQIARKVFSNIEIEINYSLLPKITSQLPYSLRCKGDTHLREFLNLSNSKKDIVKKRVYFIPIIGINKIGKIKEFVESLGYVFSGVPELMSFLLMRQQSTRIDSDRFDIPEGFNGYEGGGTSILKIIELRDIIIRPRFPSVALCLDSLERIHMRGIGGGFKNHYVICEKA